MKTKAGFVNRNFFFQGLLVMYQEYFKEKCNWSTLSTLILENNSMSVFEKISKSRFRLTSWLLAELLWLTITMVSLHTTAQEVLYSLRERFFFFVSSFKFKGLTVNFSFNSAERTLVWIMLKVSLKCFLHSRSDAAKCPYKPSQLSLKAPTLEQFLDLQNRAASWTCCKDLQSQQVEFRPARVTRASLSEKQTNKQTEQRRADSEIHKVCLPVAGSLSPWVLW